MWDRTSQVKAVVVAMDRQGEIRVRLRNRIYETELLIGCKGREELEVKCTLILAGL